jgi:hypothetical protein
MSVFGCEQCRAIAPELALGIASGDERAAALRHLAHCADCRDHVQAWTDTADRLLLATPEIEPSAGFDERVVAAFTSAAIPRARSRRTLVLAAAAAIIVALAFGAVAGWLVGRPDAEQRQYAQKGEEMIGLRQASFGLENPATRVVAYDGDPSWLLLMVNGGLEDGTYSIVCDYKGGWSLSPGTVTVRDGRGTWSSTVPRTLADLTGVRLQSLAGDPIAEAPFS